MVTIMAKNMIKLSLKPYAFPFVTLDKIHSFLKWHWKYAFVNYYASGLLGMGEPDQDERKREGMSLDKVVQVSYEREA